MVHLGVGATLTATANGALSLDSSAPAATQRVLIKDQTAQAQNGVYSVTQTGNATTAVPLTRATITIKALKKWLLVMVFMLLVDHHRTIRLGFSKRLLLLQLAQQRLCSLNLLQLQLHQFSLFLAVVRGKHCVTSIN
jgi:hypothetical protein